ncbi:putative metal-binding protein [Geoglobus ahangari]|uniref:Putative metal-binding protein n=2 Tax=Geoglobus ahangari TaxID=113653 RepID=A0A0F7DBL3_9EURY|nr:putative metal-binding protein [Geoglobus ahangari]
MVDVRELILSRMGEEGIRVVDVQEIDVSKIRPDKRTRWKCRFGCNYFGKRYSCPPNVPDDFEEFISSYSRALVVIYEFSDYMEDKLKLQRILPEIEARLIFDYPMAFALFPGGCDLCESCEYERSGRCVKPERVRPSVSSVGIIVSRLGVKIGDGKSVAIILLE